MTEVGTGQERVGGTVSAAGLEQVVVLALSVAVDLGANEAKDLFLLGDFTLDFGLQDGDLLEDLFQEL